MIIGRIYEAAVMPGLRANLLETISALIGADLGGVVLVVKSRTSGRKNPSLEQLPADEFGMDELARSGLGIGQSLANAHSESTAHLELFLREQLSPDESCVQIHKTSGAWCLSTFIKLSDCNGIIFVWERSLDLGPFDPDAQERVELIRPHLVQACLIARRTNLDQALSAIRTMELAGIPAAVLTSPQRLICANVHFEKLMPGQVQDVNGSLIFSDREAASHLERALACVRLQPPSNPPLIPVRPAGNHPAAVAHIVPWNRVSADPLAYSFFFACYFASVPL